MNIKTLAPTACLISPRSCARLLAGLAFSASGTLLAQSWDGGGADNNWSTAANWAGDLAPVANGVLTFTGATRLAAANDFAAATQFNGLTFGTSAGVFTLSGNSITLGGNITVSSFNAQSIANALVLNADRTVNVSDPNGALTLSGVVSGTGNTLTKSGSGLLTLTGGTNTFTNLTVNGGTVSVAGDGNLGSTTGTINLNGGALRTSSAITLSSTRGISLGSSTAGTGGSINASTGTTTYSGVLSNSGGTNSFTKTGAGQLTLNGASTYTGETRINQGILQVDQNAGGSINSASTLVLGGNNTALGVASSVSNAVTAPTLLVQGASALSTQTFNGLTLNQGNSAIGFRSIGATADTLALGAITRNSGGFLNLTRLKDSSGSANALVTTSTANTNGILGGWAVTNADAAVGTVAVATATDWAANDGSGNIVAYTGYTIPVGANQTLASNAANNVRIDGTSSGTLSTTAGTTDLNTIQSTDTVARTLTVGSGNVLRLGASGGIWKTQGNGNVLTIGSNDANRGTLTAGGAADTAGDIVFNANATNTATTGILVNSVIADNGTGVVSITKTGQGSLELFGTNTFTGGTYVNQGRLVTQNAGALGSGAVSIQQGGQVFFGVATTYVNDFTIAGSGTQENANFGAIRVGNGAITVGSSSSVITLAGDARIGRSGDTNVATLAGKITGDHNLELTSNGSGTEANRNVFLLTNTDNDMGGNLGINAVNLGAGQTATNNGNNVVQVRLGASEVIANGAGKGNVYIGGSATAANNSYLDLNGFSETINGLQSAGTNFAQQHVTNGRSGTPGLATLTLGDGDATATFGGILENGTGTLGLRKIGLGTQTLSGLNTYTGGTRVSAGALNYAANFTLSGANRIDVAAAGVAGTNYGTVTSSAGTVTFGGTLEINITASLVGNQTFNLFQASGGALAGDFSNVSISGSYVAGLSDSGGTWTGSVGGVDFSFVSSSGILSTSAIPEPSTYAAIFGALALAGAMIRRRRSATV